MNIRAGLLSLILLMVFFVTSAATAIEFTALGANTFTVAPGESFTIDIAVTNVSATSVQGITGRLDGLAAAGLTVTGGESALHHFVGICATFTGGCAGGIDSVDNQFFTPFDLSGGIYLPGEDSVSIISALSLNATIQAGESDPGLDADIDDIFNPSVRDISITLMGGTTEGTFGLPVTAEFSDGTSTIPIDTGLSIIVTVPEPSAVAASLAGLGAVLGVVGIRRRRH
jgi:hypothetical protein